MTQIVEGDLLWSPSAETLAQANLTQYMRWLAETRRVDAQNYGELWQWSADEISDFWTTIFDYCDLVYEGNLEPALVGTKMPMVNWFPNIRLNYAENIIAKLGAEKPVLLYKAEDQPLREVWQAELTSQVAQLAAFLRAQGVTAGDRVVAYLPNIPEAIIALLATASLGAIWSSCSPDFGARSVLDRFTQIEPKILIAVDGYQYGGRQFDRRDVVAELQAALPTLEQTVVIEQIGKDDNSLHEKSVRWVDALANDAQTIHFERLPFAHPLWILYSSGTTGLPKPIVHGHGGITIEQSKATVLQNDLKRDDRFFWYTSTGWMMWNYVVGSLLAGSTAILYNGSPAYPDMNALFALAEETGMTYFGTSAAFISACIKADIHPNQRHDLSRIKAVGSTGSPLTVDGFAWIYDNLNQGLALESLSGGTDVCSGFVGGARTLPIYAGEIQGASLGANVQAFDEDGNAVVNVVGELVITRPMPSMPVFFWNDPDKTRYKQSYFAMYDGIWRHGDWIMFNDRGGCVIFGRSDATINRSGVRMGTSEIYRIVESFDEILDSLIVDLEFRGRPSFMPLFVKLANGATLDADLMQRVADKLRADVSPRHVPNEIIAVPDIPYTLSGKKLEVPIRKILLGIAADKAANLGAMRNPESAEFFINYAHTLAR
jgi:acetoacetyl-CoA synthetase